MLRSSRAIVILSLVGFQLCQSFSVPGRPINNGLSTSCSWAKYEEKIQRLSALASSKTGKSGVNGATTNFTEADQNKAFIEGLLLNLSVSLDRWIVTGSNATKERAHGIIEQIKREAMDDEQHKQALRMAKRAMMPVNEDGGVEKKRNDEREREANERKQWENTRNMSGNVKENVSNSPNTRKASYITTGKPASGRSALSSRNANNGKPDLFMSNVDKSLDPKEFADSKVALENELEKNGSSKSQPQSGNAHSTDAIEEAEDRASELVAKAGAASAFEGKALGIGGLDGVLQKVKRRVWIPLAAPPSLLRELGINPVRGLLLYGLPGCGKTLLARSLGKILSPARPVTVVSGPEVMDRFVGSSEANLRQIFDNPPEIYDSFRIGTKDNGKALEKVALHVIVMDEFDAMARARGGNGKDQSDAGVARDSVVNQLLAKMDGIDPLAVPTLVIGLTNKRTLIEPALLRPGRFEVQIEVPKPSSDEQRISILKVHMNSMYNSGRVFVRDAPSGTVAAKQFQVKEDDNVISYDELLLLIAQRCDGMSGASLSGVTRAAASRALERAVSDFAGIHNNPDARDDGASISDCLVTQEDFENAIDDVVESSKEGDGGEDE